MYNMFKKVAAKEKIVGWYSTGPRIKPSDLEIHEVFTDTDPYIRIRIYLTWFLSDTRSFVVSVKSLSIV